MLKVTDIVCSWSGGKKSALALDLAIAAAAQPRRC